MLNFTHYEGNIYIQDEDQEKALEDLKKIADSQKKDTPEAETEQENCSEETSEDKEDEKE